MSGGEVNAGAQGNGVLSFGPFRLFSAERRLEREGSSVPLGGRAMEILLALTERPGEIWNKADLMSRVWPDVNVEDGSLRFHMVSLRKALGEGGDATRYVLNVPGRGYSFVAAVSRPTLPNPSSSAPRSLGWEAAPNVLARMVGRDAAIDEICRHLNDHPIVSVVGPGGIGKTTVAVAVAHRLTDLYDGNVHFVDLASITDQTLVDNAVAIALGLRVQSNDVGAALIKFLTGRRTLIVFDNCEHVIEKAATLAELIFDRAPDVSILATSREALRVEGEQVYVLGALETPPEGLELTAEAVAEYPAAQLLIERISAAGGGFQVKDADANVVADICRKLDGMALALELAAARVEIYGLQGVADLLDSRIRLLWRGRRTAPARQHTLSATLDWSYNLLGEVERRVLDRLSVFVGASNLKSVQAVVAVGELEPNVVLEALAGLVGKSLVTSKLTSSGTRYHLLQTTSAYVRARAAMNEDFNELAQRHAHYFNEFLSNPLSPSGSSDGELVLQGDYLGDLRAALTWAYSPDGDAAFGASLAATAARVFLERSLLSECEQWCRRALENLDASTVGSKFEMQLQVAYGQSLMFTQGNSEVVPTAFSRGAELAEYWRDDQRELQILGMLNTFQTRICDFVGAVATARRAEAVANRSGDPSSITMADFMLGVSLHGAGDQGAAEGYCQAAVGAKPKSAEAGGLHMGYDHRLRALMSLARCLWMKGQVSSGLELLNNASVEAEALGDPVTINIVMMYTAPVLIWMERWDAAEKLIDSQIAHAERHGLGPYRAVGIGLKGELAIRQGRPDAGILLLGESLERLRTERHHWWLATFLCTLADGFISLNQHEAARAAVAEAVAQYERDGETWFTAELFRSAAKVAGLQSETTAPEDFLHRAIETARQQSATAWELRSATDLARIRRSQGRAGEAASLLTDVLSKLDEGETSPDIIAASEMLIILRNQVLGAVVADNG